MKIRQNKALFLILFCLGVALVHATFAQEPFTEGIIKYKITLLTPPGPDGSPPVSGSAQNGTYLLYVKNKKVRKDLRLDGGFSSTNLSDYRVGKHIILKTVAGVRYALETDVEDELEEQKRFMNGTFSAGAGSRKIGNILVREGTLTYANGEQLHFYFDPRYKMELPYVFGQFPELDGIPAEFELDLSGGYKTHFELVSVTAEPVRNAIFRIPEGYRIISKKEYEQLAK